MCYTFLHNPICPNPARDYLNFQLRGAALRPGGQFRIVDMTGKIVKTFQAGNLADTYMVSVWGWPEGMYFLQYLEEGKVICSGKLENLCRK